MGSIPGPKQWVKGYGLASAAGEVAAEAQIQSLAQVRPYIMGVTIKKKRQNNIHERTGTQINGTI